MTGADDPPTTGARTSRSGRSWTGELRPGSCWRPATCRWSWRGRRQGGRSAPRAPRDRRIDEVAIPADPGIDAHADPVGGRPLGAAIDERAAKGGATRDGELLSLVPGQHDRWRIVTGDQRDDVMTPVGGDVIAVRPGGEVRLRAAGRALRGAFAAGSPAHGRLELATDPFGDLRPGGIDVGRAGSILVVGARIDAEALTRARAMGVRGHRGRLAAGQGPARLPRLGATPARLAPSRRSRSASSSSTAPCGGRSRPGRSAPGADRGPRGLAARSTRPRSCSRRRTTTCRPSTPTGCACARDPAPAPRAGSSVRRACAASSAACSSRRVRGDRRAGAGGDPDRRPRAHRLTAVSATLGVDALDPIHRTRRRDDRRRGDPRARRPARGRRAAGRPAVPGRRPRRGQDAVREGLRGRPRASRTPSARRRSC